MRPSASGSPSREGFFELQLVGERGWRARCPHETHFCLGGPTLRGCRLRVLPPSPLAARFPVCTDLENFPLVVGWAIEMSNLFGGCAFMQESRVKSEATTKLGVN
jgi:hypothetical protein